MADLGDIAVLCDFRGVAGVPATLPHGVLSAVRLPDVDALFTPNARARGTIIPQRWPNIVRLLEPFGLALYTPPPPRRRVDSF